MRCTEGFIPYFNNLSYDFILFPFHNCNQYNFKFGAKIEISFILSNNSKIILFKNNGLIKIFSQSATPSKNILHLSKKHITSF